MLSASCNCYAVKQYRKVYIKTVQQVLCLALRNRQLAPFVECFLRAAENALYGLSSIEFVIKFAEVVAICQSKLIFKVVVSVVYGSRRQHKHLCFHTVFHYTVHKKIVSRFLAPDCVGVSKIMAFVNYDQIIIAPVDLTEVYTVAESVLSA